MADIAAWIELSELKSRLQTFFGEEKKELSKFGSSVNQTFEAFVLAQVVAWYRSRPEWDIQTINPYEAGDQKGVFRLKFSTRGRPEGYSYFSCTREGTGEKIQIRHQLRVSTHSFRAGDDPNANICLDVAVIKEEDLTLFGTDDYVSNSALITFGEAKHMSAFAELVAGFVGLVHELQPKRLRRVRKKGMQKDHPAPFLYVSGKLYRTAEGVVRTLKHRKYDVDVFFGAEVLSDAISVPRNNPPQPRKRWSPRNPPADLASK